MLCPHICQLGQGPLEDAQLLWEDLTVPFLLAQCSQGSGWALGVAPSLAPGSGHASERTVPGSAIPQAPIQPSRPGRYETVGSVFLGVSVLLDGCPSWPGPVLCPGVCPPSQAICTSMPRSKLWVTPRRRGGRWAGTYTHGIRCSFSFCICAAFQEMPAQVLPKYSRPIPE